MSYDDNIDKDRLYFTQNNKPIRLRCPECVRITKSLRHCKIFKNLPGLWWHIKRGHGHISNLLFTTEGIVEILNAISKAKDFGIIPEPMTTFVETTTSSSILMDGRLPRMDRLDNLTKIASLFKTQSELFPNFKPKQLKALVKVILGPVDSRTMKKYINCVTNYSKKDIVNGVYDVSDFCNKVGV